MSDRLAERPGRYFTWAEFDIDHQAPLRARDRAAYRRLCRTYLDPLREQFGRCTVHSSRRTPAYNRAVGGAPRSSHLTTGPAEVAAADVSCARGTPREWARFLRSVSPRSGGIGQYADHVHVDSRLGVFDW